MRVSDVSCERLCRDTILELLLVVKKFRGVSVELFRNTNIDFLGKKWYFLAFSLIFSVAGLLSIFFWHGIPLGVEFRGGTLVYVKFAQTPNLDQIRHYMDRAGLKNPRIQRFGPASDNEVLIDLGMQETSEAALDHGQEHHHPGAADAGHRQRRQAGPEQQRHANSRAVPAAEGPAASGHRCRAPDITPWRSRSRISATRSAAEF